MYDVICESVKPATPGEAQGAGDLVIRDIPDYAEAQACADSFIHRFGHLPDVRVLIWDPEAQRTVVVHDSAETI